MNEEFDKIKYINKWQKEHKKQFKVDLNIDEYDKLDKTLKKLNIRKSDFLRDAINEFYKKIEEEENK